MQILPLVQSASLKIDLERPTTLYASTDRTMQELGDVVNTAAKQILDDYDWQRLIKTATITGDGVSTGFNLPADYSRMVQDANLWGDNGIWYTPQQTVNYNQWLQLQSYSIETWQQRWSVFGGQINVMPAVEDQSTLRYGYISNAIVTGSDPTTFVQDTDEFVLDDELLKLSIIWNWKSQKGFDFQADLAMYAERLEKLRFRDKGAKQTILSGRYSSYPWPTGQTFP